MLSHSARSESFAPRFSIMLIAAALLLILWGLGCAFRVAGALIHFLLLVAIVLFILHFLQGGKSI